MGKTLLLLLLLVVVVVVLQCIVLTMTRDYRGNLVIDYMHAVTIQTCICDLCITEATLCVCVCVCVYVCVHYVASHEHTEILKSLIKWMMRSSMFNDDRLRVIINF